MTRRLVLSSLFVLMAAMVALDSSAKRLKLPVADSRPTCSGFTITRTSTTHRRTNDHDNTTACTTDIRRACESRSTTRTGTTPTPHLGPTTAATTSSSTSSRQATRPAPGCRGGSVKLNRLLWTAVSVLGKWSFALRMIEKTANRIHAMGTDFRPHGVFLREFRQENVWTSEPYIRGGCAQEYASWSIIRGRPEFVGPVLSLVRPINARATANLAPVSSRSLLCALMFCSVEYVHASRRSRPLACETDPRG